jgi:2-hydroxy-3-keto-5-methylthiopentenyl-1-phosphate phosphatase
MADIKFIISVDEKNAQAMIEAFGGSLKDLGITAKEQVSPKLSGLWLKFAAGQLAADALKKGIRFLVGELKSSVGAAIASETATRALESALSTTGRSVDAMLPGLVSFSKEIQNQTTQTDEAALSAMALLTQLTDLDEQGLKKATEGAAGMATVFGIDLESAARNVAKAMEGNYDMMGRYIPKLKDCKGEEEKHALVMKTLGEWYGRAKSETDTFGGSLKQLGNMWDEVKEAVGKAVTENQTIKDLIGKIKTGIVDLIESGKLKEWVDDAAKAISALIKIFEGLYTAAKTVFDILDKLPTYNKAGKKFYDETMGWVEEKSAPFKKACEDFRDSLTYLKIPLENLRKESEKGPENWKAYTDKMKDLDDAMVAAKPNLEKYFEQFKPEKLTPATTETRTLTDVIKNQLDPAIINAGLSLQDYLNKELVYFSETAIPTALPACRDLKDALDKVSATVDDLAYNEMPKIPEETKKATGETKGYFDGLYNDIATGFGNMINKWLSGALTFKDFVKGIFDEIKTAFFRMIGEMVADAVLGQFKKLFSSIADVATSAISDVGKAISGAASGWATGIGAALGSFLGTVLAGIISGGPSGHAQQQAINDTKDSRNFLAEIRNWFFSAGTGFGGASYDFITGHIGEWLTSIKVSTDLTRDQMIPRLDKIVEYTSLLKKIKFGQHGLDTTVSRPTLFMAGERGTERITITPNINMRAVPIVINLDGRQVAMAIARYMPELSRDGALKIHQRGIINN